MTTGKVRRLSGSHVLPRNSVRDASKERTSGDEELGSIGVLSSVGHGEETRLAVLQLEVLVWIGGRVQETIRTKWAHPL